MNYFYKAFGVRIQSEIRIPQFIEMEDGQPDISIKFGNVKNLLPPNCGDEYVIGTNKGEIFFYFDQIGWFLIQNGNEIIVESYPGVEVQLVRLPLIGIAFASVLQQRGMLILHASAVCINNEAVAFLGWKGAGKSTTSAMFYKRGHAMISDDIVAIETTENSKPLIIPGFPNFKLMPETAAFVFGDDPDNLSRICTGAEKRYRSSYDNFLQEKVPVRAIYVLEDGDQLEAVLFKPQEAIATLIANTYLARYGKQLLQNEQAILNLRRCSNIVNSVPIYRLKRPRSLQLLDELAELVELQC